MNTPRFLPAAIACLLILQAGQHAALAAVDTYTWTGASSQNWNTANNWDPTTGPPGDTSGGTGNDAAVFPAVFTGDKSISSSARDMSGISFLSAGWTISGSGGLRLQNDGSGVPATSTIVSNGAGVNEIAGWSINARRAASYWNVGEENTLLVSSNIAATGIMVAKQGEGTLVLSGNKTASGMVYTFAGTTLVNGSATGTGNIGENDGGAIPLMWGVDAGATLGGLGSVSLGGTGTAEDPYRLIQVEGTLSPGGNGTHGAQIGTLTVNSTGAANTTSRVVMLSGSELRMDLSETAGVSDLLSITRESAAGGFLDLTDGGVRLSLWGPDISQVLGKSYTLVTFAETTGYGTFDSIWYNGQNVTNDGLFSVNYTSTSISLSVIPEPGTAILLLVAGILVRLLRSQQPNARQPRRNSRFEM